MVNAHNMLGLAETVPPLLAMLAVYRAELHANGAVPELLATLRLLPALCDPRVVQVRPMLQPLLLVSQSCIL